MSARGARVEIVRSDDGFFWRFVATNGKTLCHSEMYGRKRDAVRSAELVLARPLVSREIDERGQA